MSKVFDDGKKKNAKKRSNTKIHFTDKNAVIQEFSIPKPIIRYICKNPKPSPFLLCKLYISCKFFYPKIKIFGLEHVMLGYYECQVYKPKYFDKKQSAKLDCTKNAIYDVDFKFCSIHGFLHFYRDKAAEENSKFISLFLKKLWHFEKCYFGIQNQILTVEEFKKIANGSKSLSLENITVIDSDDTVLHCEDILNLCPMAKKFKFVTHKTGSSFTPQTAQALAQIKKPIKLKNFHLEEIPSTFDPISLSTFIKNNVENHCKNVYMVFSSEITPEEKENFVTILKQLFSGKEYKNLRISIRSN